MGLFYQHTINGDTQLGIWRIEEQEDFFLKKVPLKKDVTHPYKRLQHLAGRFLLPAMFPDFPLEEILIADTRKPFLEDEKYHFSISHCGNFAAAIVSPEHRVGVDIELVTPRMRTISKKFLNSHESNYLDNWSPISKIYLELTTVLWSAKESIFKWYGNGQVDFRKHILLSGDIVFGADEWITIPFLFTKHPEVKLKVMARIFDGLVLAWVLDGLPKEETH